MGTNFFEIVISNYNPQNYESVNSCCQNVFQSMVLCYASQFAERINLQFIHNNIKIVVIINDKTKTMNKRNDF